MRRALLFLGIALAGFSAFGQTELKPEDIPKDYSDRKPFDVETGPEAAVLKGKGVFFNVATTKIDTSASTAPARTASTKGSVPWTPFISYDVNAQYNYANRAKRIADLSLRPSIVKGWFSGEIGPDTFVIRRSLMPYVDLRSRSIGAPATAPTNADDKQKSFFYGGIGVDYRQEFQSLLKWNDLTGADVEQPTFGVTYYKKVSGELPQDAPGSFDAIQARLTFDVPIPLTASFDSARAFRAEKAKYEAAAAQSSLSGKELPAPPQRPSFPFTFTVELKASRPTQGASHKIERYADVALKMMQENSKIGYVLRYRTGKDLGFEYDQKLLAGIVMRLFK